MQWCGWEGRWGVRELAGLDGVLQGSLCRLGVKMKVVPLAADGAAGLPLLPPPASLRQVPLLLHDAQTFDGPIVCGCSPHPVARKTPLPRRARIKIMAHG